MLSLYQQYKQRWADGCGAKECGECKHVCLGRGKVPCDVLFVGEAPGESEDVLGYPFAGPAGQLLDHCIREAFEDWPGGLRCAFTNVVGCIPRTDDGTTKAAQPLPEQIRQCQPRLLDFVLLAKPKLIIAVGAVAKDWLDPLFKHGLKVPLRCTQCDEWMSPVLGSARPALGQHQGANAMCLNACAATAYRVQVADVLHPAAVLRSPVAHKALLAQKIVMGLKGAVEEYLPKE